ncbi:uncharacterized protein LOC113240307 isoform X4 [Hyposmocoma kahamanoa]|uniref:uncharacterized protein LOC113240307 isoform X4 n=1 Tax=Hyposmocoma kahamanoa TaxID=1477025 RepID=UPI000E6D8A70|nr:uncharacterized protein LOC113240307 isoform X4 [Hyposmocoma kahamanoa]
MYMKSNPKSSKEHYNNEITTKRVTPEPRHAMYSEEAESISKVLENLVSNKGIYIDKLSERQVPRETQRFFNYQLNSESYIDDRSKFIIENGKPNQENIKSVFQEPINFGTPHDLSFKALLKNIYKLFAKPQTSNENKVTRIEIDTPENKPSKHDNVNEQRPQSAAEYVKYNADENVFTNNPLNKKLNLLKSLLTNFQINKFKDNGDITATITRLEQLGNNEVCSPLTTLALKDNLSRNHNVPPSPLAGPMNDIMNRAITTHSMENINYFEKNTEKSQKLLQQYNPPLEKSMNYFEQTTEHSEKFIQEYKAPPGPRIIYLKLTTEKPQKLIQQFEAQPVKIENYSEQNTEQYQKFTQHYNAPPVETINYFEPYMEQPQKFIQHYSLPRNPDTPGIQTFVHDLANSSHENTQSSTPQRLPLKEIIFTTPSISTAINNEKFLHPDVMKEIAENVKKLVLNDIQDRILAITKPTITTEITTKNYITELNTTSNVASANNQIIPNAMKLIPTKLQPKNTTTTTLQNSPKDKTQNISTTADMFAASLTKIDSEKLKQATIIIEKFIELFKHIKLMQEIKSMAVTATPNTSKNITYKELVQPQINFPVLVDSSGYIPPTSVNMKLQDKSSLHDLLPQEFQAKPGSYDLPQELSPFDLMLQAHKRALDIQLQSIKPQQLLDINVQASKLPISFESRLHPPFPFNMKIQPSKILPIIINPYTQTLQSLPYHNLNVNQAHINNVIFKNAGNTYEEKLNSKENTNIGIGYNSKRNPFDHRSKLDPRIIHLNQMARFLRANDKEEVFSNVFKRVYTPQTLQNIYTKRNSPDNNFAIQGTPNYGDSVMVAMDSFKNKEYREKGISFDRRYNSGGANSEKIPVGYHEKLERFEERSQYKDKDWQNTPQARPSAPISNIKPPSIYNDAPFKNFLKTQQKVNKILERLLATRTDDAARSTETI